MPESILILALGLLKFVKKGLQQRFLLVRFVKFCNIILLQSNYEKRPLMLKYVKIKQVTKTLIGNHVHSWS